MNLNFYFKMGELDKPNIIETKETKTRREAMSLAESLSSEGPPNRGSKTKETFCYQKITDKLCNSEV